MKDIFPFYSIGHFMNEPHSATQFEITRFDEMEEPQVEDTHKHTFYEIIWIEKGRSRQMIDYRDYEISPGSLFFISPGQVHQFEDWRPVQGGSIFFTEEFFLLNAGHRDKLFELTFLDSYYANPVVKPRKSELDEIMQTINLLSRERRRKDYSPPMAQALLQVLLLQIQRSVDHQQSEKISGKYLVLYKKFKRLIDEQFTHNLTASHYADQLHVTQHHLNAVSKRITGKTATEVIRGRSTLEAKRFLTFSDLPITEIAAHLGYFDSSYFAKVFKAETGYTPAQFRSMSEFYRKGK